MTVYSGKQTNEGPGVAPGGINEPGQVDYNPGQGEEGEGNFEGQNEDLNNNNNDDLMSFNPNNIAQSAYPNIYNYNLQSNNDNNNDNMNVNNNNYEEESYSLNGEKFDAKCKGKNIELNGNVVSSNSSEYCSVFLDKNVSNGTHHWKFKVLQYRNYHVFELCKCRFTIKAVLVNNILAFYKFFYLPV